MSLVVDCGAGHAWNVAVQDRCPECPRGAPELDRPPRSWQWAPPPPVLGRCAQCGRQCPLDRRCTHGAGTPPPHRWEDSDTLTAGVPDAVSEPATEAVRAPRRRLPLQVSTPLRSRRDRRPVTRDDTVTGTPEQHKPCWEQMNRQELREECARAGVSQRGTVTEMRARLAATTEGR